MGKKMDAWVDEDEIEEVPPSRKRTSDRVLAEDIDPEEQDEWSRERSDRGRKPVDKKHRRPKPDYDEAP